MTEEAIIVFLKNPVEGKVKSRLAKSLGSQKALTIYLKLLEGIRNTIYRLPYDIHLFYSEKVESDSKWSFVKERWVQKGGNIGERMSHAFNCIFNRGYSKVVLIGTDIWDLQPAEIRNAMMVLNTCDVVLGPAEDGGYYLIGMKNYIPELFNLSEWSTSGVLKETLVKCQTLHLEAGMARKLRDIDEPEDLEGTGLI